MLEGIAGQTGASFKNDPSPGAPPDTQVAVGPVHVVEAINAEFQVSLRDGEFIGIAGLDSFFNLPNGFAFTDPRLIFDAASGRWLLSGAAFDASFDSNVYLAVSDTSDPTGAWTIYEVKSSLGVVMDQPKLGVNADKVVLSWNDYTNNATLFGGSETWVLQLSDLLAGVAAQHVSFGPDARFGVMPVTSLSTTTTEYLVYNNSCSGRDGIGVGTCTVNSPSLGVVAITGTPANSDVTWTESDPAIQETAVPPPAQQQAGPPIDTNDDRILGAVWRNGTLWASANDACTVSSALHACSRLIAISTTGTPSTVVDGDLAVAGSDLYYPAVTLDASGNPFVVANLSSATVNPSLVAFAASPATAGFVAVIWWTTPNGTGYVCSFCGGTNRWGDYSGIAVDPSQPDDIWAAGEITAAPGDYWGTGIGAFTLAAPTLTSISPAQGPVTGGTAVTINGANFTLESTVRFGAVSATDVNVLSPTQLRATAPAHGPGTVDVTVHTADGTSVTSNADRFTYPNPIAAHTTFNCDFRSTNGKYVSAELGYPGVLYAALRARSATVGSWEKYQCVAVGTNQWAIRSRANGKYVSAELNYTGILHAVLRARSASIGPWEKFTITATGAYFGLKSSANGDYASAELAYPGPYYALLRTRSTALGAWETYAITFDAT